MKKFFLIPLMTLVCSVMAWAEGEVAQIGETKYATLAAAVEAAEDGATITLLADAGGDFTLSKDITFEGGHKITGTITIGAPEVTMTLAGVTIDRTNNDAIVHLGKTLNVVAADGTTNAIYAKSSGCDCFYGINSGRLNISGNGTLDVYGLEAIHVSHMNLSAPNATYGASKTVIYTPQIETGVITAGTFGIDPSQYVSGSFYVKKVDSQYQVVDVGSNVAVYNNETYATLAEAVAVANVGETIVLYADPTATTVSKHIALRLNGHNADAVTAGEGYIKVTEDGLAVFNSTAASSFAEFLASNSTAEFTLTEDIDISLAGTLPVNGTKTLTIPTGKKILYARQYTGSNILVSENAKLTILGSGTFQPANGTSIETSANEVEQFGRHIIDVYGELVVGVKNDANNQPHFITTSLVRGTEAVYVRKGAQATFNNAHMQLGCVSIQNYGTTVIEGGEYISVSSASNGINNASWWSYNLQNYGKMTINGGHFQGVHGALACQNAYSRNQLENNGFEDVSYAVINGGLFETVYGTNFATGKANSADNFRALYVSNYAVVNIYGGEFKVKLPSACGQMALVDDNDAYNTFGIINMYGGKFQQKIKVGTREDVNSSYPSSIPVNSAWYSSFNTYAPLPAGYEYYDITEGEDYEAGYRYGVRAIPGANVAEVESNEPTIPWQQNTTWDADWTGGDDDVVPENNTIVTIPVGKTVVVDKDESETNAVAQQVFIAQDATLKVEDGTTLTVGEGGMNIGNGGKLIVEPGAIVKVGDAGIITTDNEALVIEATETDQAVLLYDPTVPQNENTQPQATVKLTTKSKMLNNSPFQYTYQRFALPIKAAATPENDFDPAIHKYYDATEESYGFESYIYYWNSHSWANCKWNALVPFKGYQLANNSKNGGVVYTFKGNLIGNENGEYEFAEYGFDYFGNSYTAPINVETFLSGFGSDVEATIWLYNYTMTNWQQVSLEDFSDFGVDPEYQQIKSMDGFLLNLRAASGSANVNYNDAIWSNPLLGSSPSLAPARRVANSNLSNSAVITVTEANGHGDAVTLVEKATRSSEFENGADASKYMTEDGLSLYAETNAGQLSRVATNDLNNTLITFRSGDETNYSLTIDKAQGEDYILRDNVTGNTIALANGATYNFTQAANTTVPARFEVIGIAKAPTAIDNIEEAAKISGIYTITGQFLGHDFTNLPAGVYVVNGVKIVK